MISSKDGAIDPPSNQTPFCEVENDQDKATVVTKQQICKPAGHVDKGYKSHEEDEILIEDKKTSFKDDLTRYNYLNGIIGHPQVKGNCKPTKH